MDAIDEAVETCFGYVDDLWKLEGPTYTELRMRAVLDIIGEEVVQLVEAFISKVSAFTLCYVYVYVYIQTNQNLSALIQLIDPSEGNCCQRRKYDCRLCGLPKVGDTVRKNDGDLLAKSLVEPVEGRQTRARKVCKLWA